SLLGPRGTRGPEKECRVKLLFSIIQRKVLTPIDYTTLDELASKANQADGPGRALQSYWHHCRPTQLPASWGQVSASRYVADSALARQIPNRPQLNHRFRGRGRR